MAFTERLWSVRLVHKTSGNEGQSVLGLSHGDPLAQTSQGSGVHGLAVGSGARDKAPCTSMGPPQ